MFKFSIFLLHFIYIKIRNKYDFLLTLFLPGATFVVYSHLFMFLCSLHCKQYGGAV